MRIALNKYLDEASLYRNKLRKHVAVFSHTTVNERLALFRAAKSLHRDARALEIGSHLGSSALFICAGLAHIRGRLICVDTWQNQTMGVGLKDTFSEFMENTRCYSSMITPVRKFSRDLIASDVEHPLDFVFIDGDHSEDAVRGDFSIVSKWMAKGAILAFHDIRSAFPGVGIVLGEALASGEWQLVDYIDSLGFIRRVR